VSTEPLLCTTPFQRVPLGRVCESCPNSAGTARRVRTLSPSRISAGGRTRRRCSLNWFGRTRTSREHSGYAILRLWLGRSPSTANASKTASWPCRPACLPDS